MVYLFLTLNLTTVNWWRQMFLLHRDHPSIHWSIHGHCPLQGTLAPRDEPAGTRCAHYTFRAVLIFFLWIYIMTIWTWADALLLNRPCYSFLMQKRHVWIYLRFSWECKVPMLRNFLKLDGSRKLSRRKLLRVHHRPPPSPLHPWYVRSYTPLMATLYTSKPSSTTSHWRGSEPLWQTRV